MGTEKTMPSENTVAGNYEVFPSPKEGYVLVTPRSPAFKIHIIEGAAQ